MKRLCCFLLLLLVLAWATPGQATKPAPATPPQPTPALAPAPAAQSIQDYRLDQLEKRLDALPGQLGGRLDQRAGDLERWADSTQRRVNEFLDSISIILTGLTLLLALAGLGIGWTWYSKLKIQFEITKNEVNQFKMDAARHKLDAEKYKYGAERIKQEIEVIATICRGLEKKAQDSVAAIGPMVDKMAQEVDKMGQKKELTAEEQQEVTAVAQDPNAPLIPRLQALALKAESEQNWEAAQLHWGVILEQNPGDSSAHFHLAYCLAEQAKTDKDHAGHLLKQVVQHYAKAAELAPRNYATFNNMGLALSDLAKLSSGHEQRDLFKLALDKYEQATRIDPDNAIAFSNWGVALGDMAKLSPEQEQRDLLNLALEKYEQATNIDGNYAPAHKNKGSILLHLAAPETGERRAELLGKAETALRRAEELEASRGAYNLACVQALRGDKDGCREWMEKSLAAGRLPKCDLLKTDTDLDLVREEDWFKELLAKVCGPEGGEGPGQE